jgi:hypothetical protein
MKTLLALCLLAAAANTVHAKAIDAGEFPPLFFHAIGLREVELFDSATIDGWASKYGVLNGGAFFTTDLIGANNPSTSICSWNLPEGYRMRWIEVDGNGGSMFYQIRQDWTNFNSDGSFSAAINGSIYQIGFWGTVPNMVPEFGSTIVLFGVAVGPLIISSKLAKKNLQLRLESSESM